MTSENNIIRFPTRQFEEIAGTAIDLWRLSLEEMQLLERQCNERWLEAHTDLTIVRDTMARRFPDGGAA